jgi:serine/threonine protein kinase
MGEVYVADDTRIERRVAIKVVRSEPQPYPDATTSQDAARLFQREMTAITRLDHRNILSMIDFGEEVVGGELLTYMVMPYRKEGSLNDWLRRLGTNEKLSLDDINHLITQAASALQHAHDHHIVHQDVKPSNFLIREHPNRPMRPDLLLTDFGVAKITNATATASQQVRGTPAFMPPEQWGGKPVPATDQYALAILACLLMTGSTPFVGGMGPVMHQHFTTPPPPPSSCSPRIPSTVDAVILRALAKRPDERFPSVTAFASK